ncbi:Shedu anti-phage system protein SduA domain-containing protein [Streptomyces chartreusis]|uniref:Shedu anti-phage system protein SduA domain-containing protein n=1 Tax=Streptomyces chartreusis TaxID=1969 RepID=UPI0035D67F8C
MEASGSVRDHNARFHFTEFSLVAPVSARALRAAGIAALAAARRSAQFHYDCDFGFAPLALEAGQWDGLRSAAQPDSRRQPRWGIPTGTVVQRAELHDVYGGNRSLPGSSSKSSNTFLFVRHVADREALATPRWDGDVLVVPGVVQAGDYVSRENRMVLHHVRRGLPLRVFEQQGRACRYLGEFLVDQDQPVESWVQTGTVRRSRSLTQLAREEQYPLLRLRQLTGERPFTAMSPLLAGAPRMSLTLTLNTGQDPISEGGRTTTAQAQDAPPSDAAETVRQMLEQLPRQPEALRALSHIDEAHALATLIQHARRLSDLEALRQVAEDTHASERDLQRVLQGQFWIFGGQYAGEAARRRLVAGDEVDIPLLRGDGSLQIVEIKRSMSLPGPLVKRHRGAWVPSAQVHDAVSQAQNYLTHLDEHRQRVWDQFGIEARRASALVLIGHPAAHKGIPENTVHEVLRVLNSHQTRICVLTYKELIDNAARSLGDPP